MVHGALVTARPGRGALLASTCSSDTYFDASSATDPMWDQLAQGLELVTEAWFDEPDVLASVYSRYHPGPPQSESYIPCFGYVSTKHTQVPIGTAIANATAWFDQFPTLSGMFVDEADFFDEHLSDDILSYYTALYQAIKAKSPNAGVRLNCPGCRDQRLMQACDAPVLVEQDYEQYITPGWWNGASSSWWAEIVDACHIVNSVATENAMLQVFDLAGQRNARNLYIYDGTSASYSHLPSYWNAELVRARCNKSIDSRPAETATARLVEWSTVNIWRNGRMPAS